MSDDGGLMVHFAAPDAPAHSGRGRGGKQQHQQQRKRPFSDGGSDDPNKRARPSPGKPFNKHNTGNGTNGDNSQQQQQQQPPQRRGHIVSSLFSSTDAPSKTKPSLSAESAASAAATTKFMFAKDATSFDQLGLDARIVSLLTNKMEKPITTPTPVQARGIPAVLQGNDVVLDSETGTGKTLTFVLPLVQQILTLPTKINRKDSGIVALVLSPTRELAAQTFEVLKKLLTVQIFCVPGLVTGGEHKKSEKQSLRRGINVLVATPGRLMEYIEKTKLLSFENLSYLILDEADRMLDQGFERDITRLIGMFNEQRKVTVPGLPARRQTILCSATMQDTVKRMLTVAMTNPVHVSVPKQASLVKADKADKAAAAAKKAAYNSDDDDDDSDKMDTAVASLSTSASKETDLYSFPPQLVQSYIVVPIKQRLVSLVGCLMSKFRRGRSAKGIVFFSTRRSVDFHFWSFALTPADPRAKGLPLHILVKDKGVSQPYADKTENGAGYKQLLSVLDEGKRGRKKDKNGKKAADEGPAEKNVDGEKAEEDDEDDVEEADEDEDEGVDSDEDDDAKVQQQQEKVSIRSKAYRQAIATSLQQTACVGELMPHVPVFRLHSQLSSRSRTATYEAFKKADKGVLFTTDVVARGIDLAGIDFVVQYDCPKDIFDYVHRVGRTARLGAPGESVLFLMPTETEYVDLLSEKGVNVNELVSDKFINDLPIVADEYLDRQNAKHLDEGTPKQRSATYIQNAMETFVESNPRVKELTNETFSQWIRAYATHGHTERSVFHIKRIHLGHLAKSFGLREAPSMVRDTSSSSSNSSKRGKGRPPGRDSSNKNNSNLFSAPQGPPKANGAVTSFKAGNKSNKAAAPDLSSLSRLDQLMTLGRMYSE